MKNTIKNLINQVKKAISGKASIACAEMAYANGNGDLIARTMKNNADITLFVAGIVEDVTKREMLYNKDALTFAADTGIFNGGKELPENCRTWYEIPAEEFYPVCKVSVDDLKAAATVTSADNTRPVLTAVHIDKNGYIEGCDGFRAYRKKLEAPELNAVTANAFERDNGLMISAAVAAYGFKGIIEIANGNNKYIRITDGNITIYARKLEGQYISLDSVYEGRGSFKRLNNTIHARIIDVKGFTSALKLAISAKDDKNHYRGGTIALKTRKGFIDYCIPTLNVFGSVEAETEATKEGFNNLFNPRYLMDAITDQECNTLEINQETAAAPMYIAGSADNTALVLPIRHDGEYFFTEYDASQEAPAPAAVEDDTPAADPENVTTEAEAAPEAPADVPAVSEDTDAEAEAIAEINARQNKENKFVNVSSEDVAKVLSRKAAEISEQLPPEIIKARAYYKRLNSCGFKPSEIQEADAEIIYKSNRDLLQPIARQAGGLYIDTLSIIAAIMAAFENK